MALNRAQIEVISDVDVRSALLGFYAEIDALHQATGTSQLAPVNSTQKAAQPAPPAAGLTVSGANGIYAVAISNPQQSVNKPIIHEVSYSPSPTFSSNVSTLPVSTSTAHTVPAPDVDAHFRIRSSYDGVNWSAYTMLPGGPVSAGLQSSAATDNHLVLNQSNYATVDSVAVGGSANVRLYGKSGPGSSYPSTKGGVETILPSATIINVPFESNPVVAHDGVNYSVKNTLPEVLHDQMTPIGSTSVVGSGAVRLPSIALVVNGGHVVGWNVTDGGNGITGNVTIQVTSGGGTGATPGAQTISGGQLISVAPGNPGNGYGGGDTVTVSGGVFSGTAGGGRSIGGNGGRLIYNDGTLT